MFRILFIAIFLCFSCKKGDKAFKQNEEIAVVTSEFEESKTGYNFKQPQVFQLINALEEISGLSFSDGFLYTHNDEHGRLFKIDAITGALISEVRFGEDADYEGIEIKNENLYIIKSNGEITHYNLETEKSTILENELKTKNNIEGLCFYGDDQLLIACKGATLKGSKHKEKAIYSFNLTTKELKKKPFLKITDEALEAHFRKQFKKKQFSKKERKRYINRLLDFSPSGIAIHPKTKDFYITSAKGRTLVIFNSEKELETIVFLNQTELPQPEGICFDAQANLYISTETKGTVGRIYKYKAN